jgi:hypothetical protein
MNMPDTALNRYRALRAVANAHNRACIDLICRKTLLDTARVIGLAHSGVLTLDSEDELTMVYDLCVHTARPGRSRAIDRFAHAAKFAVPSDQAVVLAAMQRARFSIWRVMGYHDEGGLVVRDVLRGGEAWLMDEWLTISCAPDFKFVGRLLAPDIFVMSSGVMLPFTVEFAAEMLLRMTPALFALEPSAMAGDYRFAQLLYRAGVATNAMENVAFVDTALAA